MFQQRASARSNNRPSSRQRPTSTFHCRPRSTGICPNRSARYSWPATKWENIDIIHLPPAGPDCVPGCGYSGLPCYVCSSKDQSNNDKLLESTVDSTNNRSSIWTIFGNRSTGESWLDRPSIPIPLSRITRTNRYNGPPPSYTVLFPGVALQDCWRSIRDAFTSQPGCCSLKLYVLKVCKLNF